MKSITTLVKYIYSAPARTRTWIHGLESVALPIAPLRHRWRFLILIRSYLQTPETHLFEFVEMTNNYPCFWKVKVVADHSTPDRFRTHIFSSIYDYLFRRQTRLLVYNSRDRRGLNQCQNFRRVLCYSINQQSIICSGQGGTRTLTPLRAQVSKTCAATNYATRP